MVNVVGLLSGVKGSAIPITSGKSHRSRHAPSEDTSTSIGPMRTKKELKTDTQSDEQSENSETSEESNSSGEIDEQETESSSSSQDSEDEDDWYIDMKLEYNAAIVVRRVHWRCTFSSFIAVVRSVLLQTACDDRQPDSRHPDKERTCWSSDDTILLEQQISIHVWDPYEKAQLSVTDKSGWRAIKNMYWNLELLALKIVLTPRLLGGSPRSGQAAIQNKSSSPSSAYASGDVVAEFRTGAVSWIKLKALGKGSSAEVFHGVTIPTGRFMAVKVLHYRTQDTEDMVTIELLNKEIELMRELEHPHVVQYYGAQRAWEPHPSANSVPGNGGTSLDIFMEYCPGGSLSMLRRWIDRERGRLPIALVREYTRQLLDGLNYLHSRRVVHRDIKCDNILIGAHGELKLADFGCSKRIATEGSNTGCYTLVGTPHYMAPEVLKFRQGSQQGEAKETTLLAEQDHDGYGTPADVWSLGCVVLEMLGRKPWPECINSWSTIYTIAHSTGPPSGTPKRCDSKLSDFLGRVFERNPDLRGKPDHLLQHEWVTCPVEDLYDVEEDSET